VKLIFKEIGSEIDAKMVDEQPLASETVTLYEPTP
jgi:hypothetical protein